MTIGAMRVTLFVPDSDSLKAKRVVVRALKDRIRGSFNVSVAEVDSQDKWQKIVLGVAAVGQDKRYIDGMLNRVLDLMRKDGRTHILDSEMEIL